MNTHIIYTQENTLYATINIEGNRNVPLEIKYRWPTYYWNYFSSLSLPKWCTVGDAIMLHLCADSLSLNKVLCKKEQKRQYQHAIGSGELFICIRNMLISFFLFLIVKRLSKVIFFEGPSSDFTWTCSIASSTRTYFWLIFQWMFWKGPSMGALNSIES